MMVMMEILKMRKKEMFEISSVLSHSRLLFNQLQLTPMVQGRIDILAPLLGGRARGRHQFLQRRENG
jgi:hypothetical protein